MGGCQLLPCCPALGCPANHTLLATFLPPSADAIYREDLVFKDPQLTFRGLRNYKLIFWSLRFHGRLFLQAANVQVRGDAAGAAQRCCEHACQAWREHSSTAMAQAGCRHVLLEMPGIGDTTER